jgi:LysM repeat protein
MKKLTLGLVTACGLIAGAAWVSAEGTLRMAPETQVYVIQRGDTLWDLSAAKLNSPWYWPRIWQLNPQVTNPHRIYPGQELLIPGHGQPAPVAAVPPAAPDEAAPAPAPAPIEQVAAPAPAMTPVQFQEPVRDEPAELETLDTLTVEQDLPVAAERPRLTTAIIPMPRTERYHVRLGSEGFIAPERIRAAGSILGAHTEKMLYSEGDLVFISLGEGAGVEVGQRFTVYRQLDEITHPETGRTMGLRTMQLGILEVVSVLPRISRARIIASYNAIDKGSFIIPFQPYERHIVAQPILDDFSGFVITPTREVSIVGEHQTIFIDRGSRHDVQIGHQFEIYRPVPAERDTVTGNMMALPPKIIGQGVVVDTQNQTATALVTNSRDFIERGDRIRPLR